MKSLSRFSRHLRKFRSVICERHSSSSIDLPTQSRVVVVGGGIIGNSIAYHLSKHWPGSDNVVLLEQDAITAGTTWHAAGLMVTYGSLSHTSTEMRKYTKKLYSDTLDPTLSLEVETGQSTGFQPIGFIELATNKDRLEEFRRVAAFNRHLCGVDVHEIGPDEVKKRFPLCDTSDVLAGFFVEDDGRVNPVDAANAFCKGARMRGAKIKEHVRVEDIEFQIDPMTGRKRVKGVWATPKNSGEKQLIICDYVVNAGGMWARELANKSNIVVPNQAAEHYYLITDKIEGVDPSWPVIEDPSSYTYIRPEGTDGKLMVGLFEAQAAPWPQTCNQLKVPPDFAFGEIEPDWDRMGPYVEKAMSRVPKTLESGVSKFFCGPESFTSDLGPLIGPVPEVDNYFVAAGLNSIGILTGGGVGRVVADWIATGDPGADVSGIHVDRAHRYQTSPAYRAHRVVESLGLVYQCHYPFRALQTARGAKRSPLHEAHKARGARFRDVSGWEGADWYENQEANSSNNEINDEDLLTWHPREAPWFKYWKEEHRTVREGVGLIDMSFMSKFHVRGKGAATLLNRLCTAEIDLPGMITYTQWLDHKGLMQGDVTVARFPNSDTDFLVIVTDTCHRHAKAWMERHAAEMISVDGQVGNVTVTDVSSQFAQINLQGPQSRQFLQELTNADMESFPFRGFREIDIGYCSEVLCSRMTYVGELGFELFVPVEQAMHVYERIIEVAKKASGLYDFRHVGLKALASLRLEKGYRDMRHDMDNLDTILEVGLGFTCDFNKKSGVKFIGHDAVQKQKGTSKQLNLERRLVQILVEDSKESSIPPMLYHGEVVFRDQVPVGEVRAGSYGHTLGGPVGLVMLEPEKTIVNQSYIDSAEQWEVQIANRRYPVKVSLKPLYDPKNQRIRGVSTPTK